VEIVSWRVSDLFLGKCHRLLREKKVELKIGNKGRVTLPTKLLKTLGLREGDVLELDAKGRAIVLKPRAISVNETRGIASKTKVDLEEIEEALGNES